SLPYALLVIGSDGIVEYVNRSFSSISGLVPSEVIGRHIDTLDIPVVPWSSPDEIRSFFERREEWSGEKEYHTVDGQVRWGVFRFIPVAGSDQSCRRFILSVIDITQRKAAEKALSESESRFKSILSNVNEYIYSVDYENGKPGKTFHSHRCSDITGYTPADFEKNPDLWYQLIYPKDRDKVIEFLQNIGTPKQMNYIEHRIVTRRGAVRWVSNSCTLHRAVDGTILRLDGFIQDITTRRDTLIQLRKFSIAIEQSPASVVITDKDGNIEYVNPKFTRLTGYTLAEVAGKNPRILKSGYMSPESYAEMWNTISSGKEWHGEFHNKNKSGELYWEAASISPLRNSHRQVTHYIAVKEDITDRKKAEEALRIKNETMEEELHYAQNVQLALLPMAPPVCGRISVSFRYKPLEMVGGDYFSFFMHDDSLRIFVGDVSGHGVPAALFLSLLRFATEKIEQECGSDPLQFISELNKTLCQYMQMYFITALYGVFGNFDGDVTFSVASGGHPPVIVYRRATGVCEYVRGKGGILGVFDDVVFETKTIYLEPGDRLFFYTDGIPEARNEKNEIIGYDRMNDIIMSTYRENLDSMLDAILNEVTAFRGGEPPDDDVVIIGCEVLPLRLS
ncbi:MAG TPA: PAS domain S-box protein, partial [Spirochaetota bacterium]|nr:PAS domain S-box protein [Spirochaetota bacterium]